MAVIQLDPEEGPFAERLGDLLPSTSTFSSLTLIKVSTFLTLPM